MEVAGASKGLAAPLLPRVHYCIAYFMRDAISGLKEKK